MAAMQSSDTHANCNDRSVVVLKTSDVKIRGNDVFMPITIEMSQIKKPERGQFKKVEITKEMTERDVREKLLATFPCLPNKRFYCAAAADGRTRLDFNGDRRIWNGRLIKRLLKGNSALYIFVDEQVPGCANMAPQSEASSRTAVATATQNRVDLDATLVSSSHSLPMGSSGHKETQPAQGPFCASSVRYSPNTLQDSSSPEQLTTKRPPEQMTTAENELSNQTFKKLRATKGVSNNTEKNVAGDLTAGSPLRALGTATVQGKVSEIPSRSYQTEGQLQNLSCRNAHMKESTLVTGQFEPPSFVCHPNVAIQDAKNTAMAIPSHSHPTTMSGNVSVKYPAPQMNSSWTSENDDYVPLQQFIGWNSPLSNLSNNFPNVNTQAIRPMETDAHGVNQDLNSSASGRRWASSDKIAVSSQGPILDDLLESSNLCWRENDSSDSEIDFSNLIALSEMDDSELTSLLSPSGVDSSLTAQASNNVGLYSQNQRHNTFEMPGPLDAMQTQVFHVMRGDNSDSGLGSQSRSSAPQSRHTSDMENSALEEYPAIIKIRPNAVGLSGAPSCEFLGLAELFPEVQSGYATVGNLEKEILWKKGDKHGNGNCIPPSPKPGKRIVKIYSVTGRKLVEAELWYMDPCHHTDDECLVRVGEKASQSYEELCRVMSNILIRCRPQASIKSGESQYSGNSESSLIVQVLRFLINEAAESGLQWDSLPLLEFVAMNHDHENAALFLEEGTERYARDITPEGRRRIDLSELLAAINASHEEDEASDTSDGRNDSDSSYHGDVESLLCDSEEPTSDSEDDHSDMLRKAFATGNEIQMGGNNAETDERVILNLPSGYLSGRQIGEKETQPTHSRLKDSTVSVKESVITERVSDQPFPTSSYSVLPFGKNGKFSRKAIAIKQREKDSKLLQGEYRISRIREHFNCVFPNLTSMKSVRQPVICFLLTTESINRCLSTMEDRWRIQLQLQRLSGRMTMSPLSMLFQAMLIKPEEAVKSLSTDADLSSPSYNTSRTRCKPFDSPLPRNDSTPSDVVALTSIYRPSGKILLSFVSDRNGFLPPESWFKDEDCELLMKCWKWRPCKNNLLALKVVEIKDQPGSGKKWLQGYFNPSQLFIPIVAHK